MTVAKSNVRRKGSYGLIIDKRRWSIGTSEELSLLAPSVWNICMALRLMSSWFRYMLSSCSFLLGLPTTCPLKIPLWMNDSDTTRLFFGLGPTRLSCSSTEDENRWLNDRCLVMMSNLLGRHHHDDVSRRGTSLCRPEKWKWAEKKHFSLSTLQWILIVSVDVEHNN